ncbi:hypothetical protein BZG36_04785 [Bifiguratus adelaidae]|uniref:Uncharacterized protein n=1 Tax=Bifiguratus adelaidae TaxID=1938954 RepID=A0A261XU01_9FUNG|nr:hypothetical protein BZG36_04785 [Bifiguratus adelaidae]
MGHSASKARRFPQQIKAVEKPAVSPTTVDKSRYDTAASETRTSVIEEDARDPDLHKKLADLGPVQIADLKTPYRTNDTMIEIVRQRQRQDAAEPSPYSSPSPANTPQNLITTSSLFALLQTRNHLSRSQQADALPDLSRQYGLDQDTIKSLFLYVNTFTVDGEEGDRKRGVWVEDAESMQQVEQRAQQAALNKSAPATASPTLEAKEEQKDKTPTNPKKIKELFEDE